MFALTSLVSNKSRLIIPIETFLILCVCIFIVGQYNCMNFFMKIPFFGDLRMHGDRGGDIAETFPGLLHLAHEIN